MEVPGRTATPARILMLPAFGEIEAARLLGLDDLFAVVSDKYPVSPGHTLIIARRPVTRFQELTGAEKARLLVWIDWTQEHLASNLSPAPDGFNVALNDGPAAGQTMLQLHFHVIPRYTGGVPEPRGGIRHVIPTKARYWQ
jgi:diadenosine tetraphosphate (Ap4A) HIT family hydrolase